MAFYDARHGVKAPPESYMPQGTPVANDGMDTYERLMRVANGKA